MIKQFTTLAITAMLLGACATSGITRVDAGKALATAWTALDGAAIGVSTAVATGKLKGAPAAVVSTDLKNAVAALSAAQDAYDRLGATTDPTAQILISTIAVTEISSILGAIK